LPAQIGATTRAARITQDGYRVTSVPPSLTIFNTGEDYQRISGWDGALDNCLDMAASRRDYLKGQLSLLTSNPTAYVTATGRLRTRRPQWL
jgi:hypothetical protein